MAYLKLNWVWVLFWAGLILPLIVQPTSQWMAGLVILPLMVAVILIAVRKYKGDIAEIRSCAAMPKRQVGQHRSDDKMRPAE